MSIVLQQTIRRFKLGFLSQLRVTHDLIGKIVRTRYNNRTYVIDDVLFDKNPSSTYSEASEETIDGYYRRVRVQASRVMKWQNQKCVINLILLAEVRHTPPRHAPTDHGRQAQAEGPPGGAWWKASARFPRSGSLRAGRDPWRNPVRFRY
jgi:hypothetical protein